MIHEIIQTILPNVVIFAGLYIAVLLAILADLVSGCRKAKKDGFLRSSKGLRRTVRKIGEYYNLMFVISVIDIVQMVAIFQGGWNFVQMPFLSFVATIFLCIIELKSIYERRSEKERADMETVAKFLANAMKNKDTKEVINVLSEIIDWK
jgi:hypothetical protein